MTSRFWGAGQNGLAGGFPAGGFDPASLFTGAIAGDVYDPYDLSQMYQTIDTSTPVTATTQPVARLNGKINGHNLLQSAVGQRPTLQQASGWQHLLYDGVDDLLQSLAWTSIPQPFDVLCSLQQDTWGANRYIFDGGVGDQMILRQNGSTPGLEIYAGAAACNNVAAVLGTRVFAALRVNGASSSLTIGTTVVTGSAGANALTGLTVGGRFSGAPFCPIRMGRIIARAGTMDAAQLANGKAWVMA